MFLGGTVLITAGCSEAGKAGNTRSPEAEVANSKLNQAPSSKRVPVTKNSDDSHISIESPSRSIASSHPKIDEPLVDDAGLPMDQFESSETESIDSDPNLESRSPTRDDVDLSPSVNVSGDATMVYWDMEEGVEYEEMEVILAQSDGSQIKQRFKPGEEVSFAEDLPDGTYQWETRATPYIDPEIRQEIRAARESGDNAEEQKLITMYREQGYLPTREEIESNFQSGSFTIRDGLIVNGALRE